MIEIVSFNRPIIGYRQNKAVVYASVPEDLTDEEAKQYGYEQVWKALEYEQTKDRPSIDGSNMESIEEFTPEPPKVKLIKLIGNSFVQFEKGEEERALRFIAEATDQYGEPIEDEWEWTGAVDGELTVTPEEKTVEVIVSADGVSDSLTVHVYPYVEPVPHVDEMEVLKARLQAVSDRTDFQDDVITEVIMELYQ